MDKSFLWVGFLWLRNMDCCAHPDAAAEAADEMSAALGPPQRRWEMLLKMEFTFSSSPPLMLPPGCPQLFDSGLFIRPASPAASPARYRGTAVLQNVSQIQDGDAKCYL